MPRPKRNEFMLAPPSLEQLSAEEREWVEKAREICEQEPYCITGGYDQSVNPELVGFCVSRERQMAFPVYETDNSLMAVNYMPEDNSVESWPVKDSQVYPATLNFDSPPNAGR